MKRFGIGLPAAFVLALAVLGGCDSGVAVDPADDPADEPTSPSDEVQVSLSEIVSGGIVLKKNPFGISPLSATVSLTSFEPTRVSVEVLGEVPAAHEFETLATHHESLAVLGLYPGQENEVVVRVSIPDSVFAADTVRFVAPSLPDFFPTVEILKADHSQSEPGWTASALSIGENGVFRPYPFIFDSNGVIRWYLDLSFIGNPTVTVERLANGNMLAGDGRWLYEYDMLGNEVNSWNLTPYLVHHDFVEKPDGNLIVAVDVEGLDTIEDHMIELDRSTGTIVTVWDLREVLDVDRFEFQKNEQDWLHVNAVIYDETDDSLIISGRNQGVFKVTRNNELVWILAPHVGWGQAGVDGDGHDTSEFLLTAVDASGSPLPEDVQNGETEPDEFGWAWGQHAPLFLPNGNLFLFDNGNNRLFAGDSLLYSRGVEYRIDEAAMTVEQIWQYGKKRGEEFYAFIISDVDYLAETGNRLIMPGLVDLNAPSGSYALVTELAGASTQIVFEARINLKNMFGNGMGFGQFDIVYRSERLPLYPPGLGGGAPFAPRFSHRR